MRNLVLACVALSSCSKSPPRQDWVNGDRIDKATWGTLCGRPDGGATLPAGEPGVSTRHWKSFGGRGEPVISCSLGYDNRSGRIWRLSVNIGLTDRQYAERLLGDLIIQYLPPDAQLVARAAAFPEVDGYTMRAVGAFKIDGSWESTEIPGKSNVYLYVRLGEPPASRSATDQAAVP